MDDKLRRITWTLAAMAAGGALTLVLLTASRRDLVPTATAQERFGFELPGGRAAAGRGSAAAADLSSAFRDVASLMRGSVVSIATTTVRVPQVQLPPGFEQFFGRPRAQKSEGQGSGVIVRSDGYILTNNHVIEGVTELTVELSSGEKIAGRVVGTDPQTDLAVVKIGRDGLPAVRFGNSDDIRVGDWVLAIGSPFGLEQTVTAGIISGKNRSQGIIDQGFEDFLQTDAAINPGNSGGPLVNLRGELVGINTAILSKTGSNNGIGFAIPMSMALPVLEQIVESGQVRRGFLGAKVVDVTPELIERFDLRVNQGAFIYEMLNDRPAQRSGLQVGDVVVEIEGRPCQSGTRLRTYVASRRPGATFTVTVDRAGQRRPLQIRLDERTDEAMSAFGAGVVLGARVVPMTPSTAREYGYEDDAKGLVLIDVPDQSEAGQAGMEPGDVIESLARVDLDSAEQFADILKRGRQSGRQIPMVVRRGNNRIMAAVE